MDFVPEIFDVSESVLHVERARMEFVPEIFDVGDSVLHVERARMELVPEVLRGGDAARDGVRPGYLSAHRIRGADEGGGRRGMSGRDGGVDRVLSGRSQIRLSLVVTHVVADLGQRRLILLHHPHEVLEVRVISTDVTQVTRGVGVHLRLERLDRLVDDGELRIHPRLLRHPGVRSGASRAWVTHAYVGPNWRSRVARMRARGAVRMSGGGTGHVRSRDGRGLHVLRSDFGSFSRLGRRVPSVMGIPSHFRGYHVGETADGRGDCVHGL
jgi:hypothetical protein